MTDMTNNDRLVLPAVASLNAMVDESPLTQSSISNVSGVSTRTIQKIFRGTVSPRVDTLSKIANAVGAELVIQRKK